MASTLTNIVKRLQKGAPLTVAEGDANLTAIQNFVNGLSSTIGVSVNPDGTLTDGALSKTSQIGNAPVIADTLAAAESLPVGTLTTGNYIVTNPSVVSYLPGGRVKFKASASSLGGDSVQVNALAVVPIMVAVSVPIKPGNILIDQVVELEFDGTNFQLVSMVPLTASISDIIGATDDTKPISSLSLSSTKFTSPANYSIAGTGSIVNIPHGFVNAASAGVVPRDVRWVLVCQNPEAGYLAGDEIGIEKFSARTSAADADNDGPQFGERSTTTNLVLIRQSWANINLVTSATDGSRANFTPANWMAKCYASV